MDEELSSDLNLFEGLDGFEKFDPMDDSSLMAILDDLEEGTLLSLLGDDTILNDMTEETYAIHGKCCESDVEIPDFLLDESKGSPLCDSFFPGAINNGINTVKSNNCTISHEVSPALRAGHELDVCSSTHTTKNTSATKRSLQDTSQVSSLKRAKLDNSSTDTGHLLMCIQHDHCYVPCMTGGEDRSDNVCNEQRSPIGSSSDEEGSLSDAGYDTMSSSTSPGNNSTLSSDTSLPVSGSAQSVNLDAPSINPLVSKVDPVALIDARIQHFMCSREVNLTEEEKETLKGEGLPIPTTLPLTKAEEKALRGVRRKIRNKVAAQESRKRKKEHLASLEDRCKQYSSENCQLKKKVEALENDNRTLRTELNKFRELLASHAGNSGKTTRVGACLMVIVLCFAIFFGSITPHTLWSRPTDYTTSSVRSRSLLSMEDSSNFHTQACDWFRQIFMLEKLSEDEYGAYQPLSDYKKSQPPLLYGPLSYYEHVYFQVSEYLNYTNDICSIAETSNFSSSSPVTSTQC